MQDFEVLWAGRRAAFARCPEGCPDFDFINQIDLTEPLQPGAAGDLGYNHDSANNSLDAVGRNVQGYSEAEAVRRGRVGAAVRKGVPLGKPGKGSRRRKKKSQ